MSRNRSALRYLKYILFFGIGILLLWLVYRKQDLSQTWEALKSANYAWVGASLAIIFVSHAVRALRWRMLITPVGSTPRFSTTLGAVFIGYFANLLFPRLGEVSKCGVINRYERIPVDKLVGTMITERAIDLVTLLLLTAAIVFLEFEKLGSFFSEEIAKPLGEKFTANQTLLIIVAVGVIVLSAVTLLLYRRFGKQNLFVRIREIAKGVWTGVKSIAYVRNLPLLVFYSLLVWACYYFATWACFKAMPETESLGGMAALALLVFGSYGMVAPVQGGLGAFHVMAIATLQTFAIAKEPAGNYAFLIHGSQMGMVIVLGFVALILLPFIHRRTRDRATTTQLKTS